MPDAPPGLPTSPIARARILVVDDQPLNIQLAHQVLGGQHEVFMATSGERALQFCQDQQPDLVLMDVVMPGLDGLETCRRLKSDPATRDIPVVFVTALGSPEEESRCWEAGCADFVSKPIHALTLRHRVQAQLSLRRATQHLRQLVYLDGLTGVANRRRFDEQLATEWRRCQRQLRPLGLILIDVDFFKRYNDRHGHQAGDTCLRRVAQACAAVLQRPGDLIARYGGEELVCLLPDTDAFGLAALMRQLLQAVAELAIPHGDSSASPWVSISLGGASLNPDAAGDGETLVQAADRQLYLAKAAGRARGRIAGDDADVLVD